VLATNAYTHKLLPGLRFRFIPLYDYVMVSEPLDARQRDVIGWRNRQGVADVRTFFNYYRLTADDRVLWGTSEAVYYPGNRVDEACDHSERHYDELRRSFVRHFPDLEGLEFPYGLGRADLRDDALHAVLRRGPQGTPALRPRYTGHGLGTTHLAGRILSHMVLERPSPLLELKLVREKPFPYPPEPLRTWAVRAATADLRRVDEGHEPSLLLRCLDALGIGLSS
jgi:glycine/D-amino acid oxidase-like deaminating enzyme